MSQVVDPPVSVHRPSRVTDWSVIAAAALMVAIGALTGLRFQHALWNGTQPVRFIFDIANAYNQGRMAADQGLLDTYDVVARRAFRRLDGVMDYGLDYPPLRLTAACWWHQWTRAHFHGSAYWQNTWEFNEPLLMMNRAYLALAAISGGLLVHMARRWPAQRNHQLRLSTGVLPGVLTATTIWFSPVANLVGFAWPQWDICVPAFFLAATYAGCRNRWLIAGILIAMGAMFKGQVLVGLPLLVLWPLVCGNFSGVCRLAIGFVFAAGVIVAPFMFHENTSVIRPTVCWFAGALLTSSFVAASLRTAPRRWRLLGIVVMVAACAIAALSAAGWAGAAISVVLATMIMAAALRVPLRWMPAIAASAVAGALCTCGIIGPSSWNWLYVGFVYGTEHFNAMTMGHPGNLADILRDAFGVTDPQAVAFAFPLKTGLMAPTEFAVRWGTLMRMVFVLCAIFCGITAGIHYRRRNPAFLVSLAALWMCFVALPAQIHERYVLYPALVSALFLGLGVGPAFMHLAIALIAVPPVLEGMLSLGNATRWLGDSWGPSLQRVVNATEPGLGWALLTLTFVALAMALPTDRSTLKD